MPSLDINILNAALSAMVETKVFVLEEKPQEEWTNRGNHCEQIDIDSFNQFNRVGDDVDSITERNIPPARQSIYQQIDLDSLHQTSLVGGDVGSAVPND